jgi:hypothetical protein
MPAPMTIARGNQLFDTGIALTLTPPASIPISILTFANYTVPGLAVLDLISVNFQSSVTNLSIANAYVSAPNTLTIGWSNETAGTVSSAAAINCLLEVIRLENASQGFASLPNGIQ